MLYIDSIKQVLLYNLEESLLFIFVNSNTTDVFYNILHAGICVNVERFNTYHNLLNYLINDNNIITSNYNLNTTTGRPSNTNGVNFAALNKSTGERLFIVSRFANGVLLLIDFSGYHLALVADLVDYKFPDNSNIHKHMAELYFNTTSPSTLQIKKGKLLSFTLLYGGIQPQYRHILFLRKVDLYTNRL